MSKSKKSPKSNDVQPCMIFRETVSTVKILRLFTLTSHKLNPDEVSTLLDYLAFHDLNTDTCTLTVEYYCNGDDEERMYAKNGSQRLSKEVRAYLFSEYMDIDLQACCVNILLELANDNNLLRDRIELYLIHYDQVTQSDPTIKQQVREQIFDCNRKIKPNHPFHDLLSQISDVAKHIGSNLVSQINKMERQRINKLIKLCNNNGVEIIAYMFDGLIVEKGPKVKFVMDTFNKTLYQKVIHKKWQENISKMPVISLNSFDTDDETTIDIMNRYGHKKYDSYIEAFTDTYQSMLKCIRSIDCKNYIIKKGRFKVDLTNKCNYTLQIAKKHVYITNLMKMVPQLFTFSSITYFHPYQGCFSMFPGFLVKTDHVRSDYIKHCEPITDHIKEIWCDNDLEMYEYTLDWFAAIVQDYPKLTETIMLFNGDEGTGKSILFKFLVKRIFGELCITITGCEKLTRSFNSHLCGKILVCLEELKGDSDQSYKADINRIKHIVTSDSIDIEKKGIDVYSDVNALNIIAFSNYDNPLPPVVGINRRIVQKISSRKRMEDSKYFTDLGNYLEKDPDAPACFLKLLQTRKVDHDRLRFHKPQSDEKYQSKWAVLHDVDKALYYLMMKDPEPQKFHARDLLKTIAKFSKKEWTGVGVGRRLSSLKLPKTQIYEKGWEYTISSDNFKIDPKMMECCKEYVTEELDESILDKIFI